MAGRFEIYTDKAGDFRFRLKASNGQGVLMSEGYKSKANARKGAESVQKNCDDPDRFEKKSTGSGKYRFSLKAENQQVIGQSENYESATARDNGIEAVGRAAKGAEIVDLTA